MEKPWSNVTFIQEFGPAVKSMKMMEEKKGATLEGMSGIHTLNAIYDNVSLKCLPYQILSVESDLGMGVG